MYINTIYPFSISLHLQNELKPLKNKEFKDLFEHERFEHAVFDVGEDYIELIIQFGFVVMFGTLLPLAPLFAYVRNLLDGILDGNSLPVSLHSLSLSHVS